MLSAILAEFYGISLRTIQEISGHSDLGTLQRYLDVTLEQKRKAVSVIGF
ncbi:integrase [Nostoc sp. 106C]|nr:integrase [Nostoc sp. 106C]